MFALAAGAAAASHTFTITAIVRDADGRTSSALTARDFIVEENRHPRPITSFRNLRPPLGLISKRPSNDYTISNRPLAAMGSQQPVNVVILDTRNTDPEFQPWMQSQAQRFLAMLRPEADVAFYQLAGPGLRLIHEFSHDKSQLSRTLAEISEPATAGEFERESSSETLRLKRYRETCEAISQMAGYLGQFAHRKNLVWISADFPPVFKTANPECTAMAMALNRNNTALYPVEVRSPIAKEPFQPVAPGDLQSMPRKRREALSREWLDTMSTLAALTGGKPIENRSQLAEAMVDALAETRFAYELGFDIPDAMCDGGLHPLRVQVKMRDATVLAKQALAADCGDRQLPAALFDSPAIGVSVTPLVRSAAGVPVRIRVSIASSDLQWSKAGNARHASVSIRCEGGTAAGETKFQLTSAEGSSEPAAVEIAVKPLSGAQTLRVLVRDEAHQREGSVTVPITVFNREHNAG